MNVMPLEGISKPHSFHFP